MRVLIAEDDPAGRRIREVHNALGLRGALDPLTGALNRSCMVEILQREIQASASTGAPIATLLVDLDNFSAVNQKHGRAIGDVVLREIAQRASAALHPQDAVARFGGDELLIMLPACDRARALTVAEEVRKRIAGTPVLTSAGDMCQTVSIGVATLAAPERAGAYDMVLAADAALYEAKNGGRDRVAVAVVGDDAAPSDGY